ncbi:DUF559 domain-containing protein [Mesorhizobium sp. RP14(2022)]|uniref:DUF559 domain-containing protein n=2 Tax=Mesorhizobium liriopis TaxID=2953882 RepID=A0ABT1C298_9HYPH|nr:DUF559 domain-containing protein [Mesorhizobium liriopis]
MTEGETRLWHELKGFRRLYGIHVRKQVPIGSYVVDFAIHDLKLVIEVDGQHHQLPERQARDAERDGWLNAQGYRVLRFNTGELSASFDGCIEEILREIGVDQPGGDLTPTPNLPFAWLKAFEARKAISMAFRRPECRRSSPPQGGGERRRELLPLEEEV